MVDRITYHPSQIIPGAEQFEREDEAIKSLDRSQEHFFSYLDDADALRNLKPKDVGAYAADTIDQEFPDLPTQMRKDYATKLAKEHWRRMQKELQNIEGITQEAVKRGAHEGYENIFWTPEQRIAHQEGRPVTLDHNQAIDQMVSEAPDTATMMRLLRGEGIGKGEPLQERYQELRLNAANRPKVQEPGIWGHAIEQFYRGGRAGGSGVAAGIEEGQKATEGQPLESTKQEHGLPYYLREAGLQALAGPLAAGPLAVANAPQLGSLFQVLEPGEKGKDPNYRGLQEIGGALLGQGQIAGISTKALADPTLLRQIGSAAMKGIKGGWEDEEHTTDLVQTMRETAKRYKQAATQQIKTERPEITTAEKAFPLIKERFQQLMEADVGRAWVENPEMARLTAEVLLDPLNLLGPVTRAAKATGLPGLAAKVPGVQKATSMAGGAIPGGLLGGIVGGDVGMLAGAAGGAGLRAAGPKAITRGVIKIVRTAAEMKGGQKGLEKADRIIEQTRRMLVYEPHAFDMERGTQEAQEMGSLMRLGHEEAGPLVRHTVNQLTENVALLQDLKSTPKLFQERVWNAFEQYGSLTGQAHLEMASVGRQALSPEAQKYYDALAGMSDWHRNVRRETGLGYDWRQGERVLAERPGYIPHRAKFSERLAGEVTRDPHKMPGAAEASEVIKRGREGLEIGSAKARGGKLIPDKVAFDHWVDELQEMVPKMEAAYELQKLNATSIEREMIATFNRTDVDGLAKRYEKLQASQAKLPDRMAKAQARVAKATAREREAVEKLGELQDLLKKAPADMQNTVRAQLRRWTKILKGRTGKREGLGGKEARLREYNKYSAARHLQEVEQAAVSEEARAKAMLEMVAAREAETGVRWISLEGETQLGDKLRKLVAAGELSKGKQITYVPVPIKDKLDVLLPFMDDSLGFTKMEKLRQGYDKIMSATVRPALSFWRITKTVPNPLFIARNGFSGVALTAMGLGLKGLNPKLHIVAAAGAIMGAASGQAASSRFLKNIKWTMGSGEVTDLGIIWKRFTETGLGSQLEQHLAAESAVSVTKNLYQRAPEAYKRLLSFGDIKGLRYASPMFWNRATENYQHFTTFLGFLNNLTPQGIAKAVDSSSKWSANYARLSPFEKSFMRDGFGFYAWQKFIGKHFFSSIMENPDRIAAFVKARKHLERDYSAPGAPGWQAWAPWIRGHGVMSPEDMQPGDDTHRFAVTTLEDPITMWMGTLRPLFSSLGFEDPTVSHERAGSLMSPLVVNVVEFLTGRDFRTAQPLPPYTPSREELFNIPAWKDTQLSAMLYGMVDRPTDSFMRMVDLYMNDDKPWLAADMWLRYKAGRDFLGLDHILAPMMGKEPLSIGGMLETGMLGTSQYLQDALRNAQFQQQRTGKEMDRAMKARSKE